MRDKITITRQQIQSRTVGESYSRGETLFEDGAIFLPVQRINELSALCVGSSAAAYYVTARFDASGIRETDCTCPYDWGGDCKHIVAMLLNYLHQPERFRVGKSLQDELMSLEKEDLVGIVKQMIARYTGLEDIVEHMINEVVHWNGERCGF